jgi:hypothetical protein
VGRFEEPNIGLPVLGSPGPCELFLLGYVLLQMAQRKKLDHKRMKATIEAMRNKEMGSYKASSVFSVPQTTLECCIKGR